MSYINGKKCISLIRTCVETEEKTATPTQEVQEITPSEGKYLSKVVVNAIPNTYVKPSGHLELTTTGTYVVKNYMYASIKEDNLIAENIKSGVSILGVTGTYEGSSENTLKKLLDTTKSAYYLFNNYIGTSVDDIIQYSDTENVTDMAFMFSGCSNLKTIPQINTSNVINMGYMFNYCKSIQTIPQLDTSNVTSMYDMFYSCIELLTIPQLDTSQVTNMSSMFFFCIYLQTIPQLDTSQVTNMSSMFGHCRRLQTIDLTYMKITNSSNSSQFARDCYSLTKLIIRNMDSLPVINSDSFDSCYHFLGTVNSTYNPTGAKDGRIYVPDDKVEELKSATNWSAYADIIVGLSELEE